LKVIYAESHRQHHPAFEILEGGEKVPLFESPDRMDIVLAALNQTDWVEIVPPSDFGLEPILAVHDAGYINFLQHGFAEWQVEGGQLKQQARDVLMGTTFPPRRWQHKPTSVGGRVGYYTFDLSCPIVAGTFPAALSAAHCALTGAQFVIDGALAVFALCRPPGHHAGRDFAGGYCYLNNASIAAKFLSIHAPTAILDVDYHAGNGTEDIFYLSPDVLTISLHADPNRQYPYFAGYADETGEGAGKGYHHNFPLPKATDDDVYCQTLTDALALIRDFAPHYLVLSFGADIYAGDPLGDLTLTTAGFSRIGALIEGLGLPTLIVMEGGYNIAELGTNTVTLLSAFARREAVRQ
jgi:acetoin utilization deacetylase AcuC-like enzyme